MSFPALSPLAENIFQIPPGAQRQSNLCSMVNFYPEARRIMDKISLGHIVEIGSEAGANTTALLKYVNSRNARLTTVDPVIVQFPFAVSQEKDFTFFQGTSRVFLESDFCAEVIFMDGDHNYETVINDLRIIHQRRSENKIKIIFLHDVSWPWARRDNYYNLEQVKAPHPNHDDTAVSPYMSAEKFYLPPAGYSVADSEGGECNGVLTAVEDFLKESEKSWVFWHIPVIYGIGILCCTDNLSSDEYQMIRLLTEELLTHRELLATLELNRIENLCLIQSLADELKKAGQVWREDQGYIAQANSSLAELTERCEAGTLQIGHLQELNAVLKDSLAASTANESFIKDICSKLTAELELIRSDCELKKAECRSLESSVNELTEKILMISGERDALQQQKEVLQVQLDTKGQEYMALAGRTNELESSLNQTLTLKANLENIVWQRDQELRQLRLMQSGEQWRIRESAICRCLPYRVRNRKKLGKIAGFLNPSRTAVLSLDVFDTLLLRDYHSEMKRFSEIAALFNGRYPDISRQTFYEARTVAHRLTYQSKAAVQGCKEAQAEAIFQCMTRILDLPFEAAEVLAGLELGYETEHLRANPVICDMVRLAQRNDIQVIAVSDMYWSAEKISELLAACLPKDLKIDHVYSSSDFGISKASGLLFDRVLKQIQCPAEKLLHLGDNKNSDCIVPYLQHGINAVWLPRAHQYNWYCARQQKNFMKKLQARGVINGI